MQIDLAEIRKLLPTAGGHLSLELRDDQGRIVASATFVVASLDRTATDRVSGPGAAGSRQEETEPPGPNYLSILT
jgi:hypothetical protein